MESLLQVQKKKLNKKKITELVRDIKKRLLSTVHSQIVKNMKTLLSSAHPGFISSCSVAIDNLKQLGRS